MLLGRPVIGGNIGGIPNRSVMALMAIWLSPAIVTRWHNWMDKLAGQTLSWPAEWALMPPAAGRKYDLARHMQVLQALYQQLVGEKK